jgi:hypothetical protein
MPCCELDEYARNKQLVGGWVKNVRDYNPLPVILMVIS